MNDLISVVIPVYKVEKYLGKCLDSIINQTYKNLEIIVVNDGSPDNCSKIIEEYSKKDKRIKVINKVNGGLSDARNVGIENSNGKYISFVDSDDYVSKYYFETLYNNLNKYNCEISICNQIIFEEKDTIVDKINSEDIKIYNSTEALKLMLYQKKINNSAWGKLYLKSLFEKVRYPKGKIYEDIPTTYKTFLNSEKICVSSCKYYFYLKRNNSISSKFSENTLDILENVYAMKEDLKRYSEYNNAVNSRVINAEFFILRQIDKNKYTDIYQKIIKSIKNKRKSVLFDKKCRLKTKIGILLSYLFLENMNKIYNYVKNLKIVKKLD